MYSIAEKMNRAEAICDHTFSDRDLLRSAITHPSAVEGQPVSASYERLEFLGDSILGSIVALALFKAYPNFDEGKLTRLKVSLVSGATLSDVGLELGIDKCIVFGAMYLDGGWDVAEAFISRTLKPHLATERAEHPSNPKSFLQECVQGDRFDPPAYKLVDTSGPAHAPTFTAVALVDGIRRGRGTGSSKKEAEAAAALDALERMGYTHNGVILKKKLG